MDEPERKESGELVDQALAVLNFHLRFASVKLCKQTRPVRDQDGQLVYVSRDELRMVASFDNSTHVTDNHHCERRRQTSPFGRLFYRILWVAINLVKFYTVVEFIHLSILHVKHDRLVERIWKTSSILLGANNNSPSSCLETIGNTSNHFGDDNDDSHRHSEEDHGELVELANAIDRSGSPTRSLLGINSLSFLYLAIGNICFYYMGYLSILVKRPRLNLWDFIRDRAGERRKFTLDVFNLVCSLFLVKEVKASEDGDGDHGRVLKFHYILNNNRPHRSRLKRKSWLLDKDNFELDYEELKARTSIYCNRVITDQELHLLVEPAHLADWWHQKICHYLRLLPTIRLVFGSPGLMTVILSIILDIMMRVEARLIQFRCVQPSESTSFTAQTHIHLSPLESKAHIEAYRSYTGSAMDTLALAWLELSLHCTFRLAITLVQLLCTFCVILLLVPFYSMIYIYDYVTNMLWLTQIERQLDECLNLLIEGSKLSQSELDNQVACDRRIESIRLITLAYLNYELFRREQRNYQSLTNILIMQMFLMNAATLAVCYYLCVVLRSANNIVSLIVVTYGGVFLNGYFVTCAIRTSKLIRLMKNICRLAAFSVDNSLRLSPILSLWSSQILTRSEATSCFAPKLFGISLTYDKIIPFNAYLLALWFLVFRG